MGKRLTAEPKELRQCMVLRGSKIRQLWHVATQLFAVQGFSCGQLQFRVRSIPHQSVLLGGSTWAHTLAGIRLGILIREAKARDRNPGLSVCLVGAICGSLTGSNDGRKLGPRSRRTRCPISLLVDEGNPRLLLRQPYLVHHFREPRVGTYGVESEVSFQAL